MSTKRWELAPPPPTDYLAAHPAAHHTLLTLLYQRGLITEAEREQFICPSYESGVHDPFLFAHMRTAVDTIFAAIEKKETICIYGDYDADGISGSIILSSLFEALKYNHVEVFLPRRDLDGYGLSSRAVRELADKGVKLIITCDCGISNKAEIAEAKTHGIEVIITDHHTCPPELPPAKAIIHPKVPGETYPDQTLAGGAVAFKLAQGVLAEHAKNHTQLPTGETHAAFTKWQLDMCAIACVADMVPLRGEARVLTKFGLIVLEKTRRAGLKELCKAAGLINNNGELTKSFDAETIGFQIGPRLNAAGRMGDARLAYDLIASKDAVTAKQQAAALEEINVQRKTLTSHTTDMAAQQAQEQVAAGEGLIMVYHKDWQKGLTGLVAGQLVQRFDRPAFVLAGSGKSISASGRSIEGFNMIKALQDNAKAFVKFGGHPMACGFSLTEEMMAEAKTALQGAYSAQTGKENLLPTLRIDTTLTLGQITWELVDELAKLEPYGQENLKPVFLFENVQIADLEPLGQNGAHLKLFVKDEHTGPVQVIGWKCCAGAETNLCEILHKGERIDLVAQVVVNEWNGRRELRLELIDIKKVAS